MYRAEQGKGVGDRRAQRRYWVLLLVTLLTKPRSVGKQGKPNQRPPRWHEQVCSLALLLSPCGSDGTQTQVQSARHIPKAQEDGKRDRENVCERRDSIHEIDL